ncbi:MAG: hypothetical protein KAG66_14555 [Methylococcales bacterium]|nr:hypothetical protein [Methylococcales bacterium]
MNNEIATLCQRHAFLKRGPTTRTNDRLQIRTMDFAELSGQRSGIDDCRTGQPVTEAITTR